MACSEQWQRIGSDPSMIPAEFASAPYLEKPLDERCLLDDLGGHVGWPSRAGSRHSRVLQEEADHLAAGVGSACIRIGSCWAAAGPRMANAVKDPLLQH